MKKPTATESAASLIDNKIRELGDWRGKMLAKVREILHQADPEIVEEWKWGTSVWSHGAIDIPEGDKVDAAALKNLIRAAVALNLAGKESAKLKRPD